MKKGFTREGKTDRQRKRKRIMSQRMRQKVMVRNLVLAGMAGVVILIIVGILNLCIWSSLNKVDANKISNNIYIGQVDVSGMSKTEALDALEKFKTRADELQVTVKIKENRANVKFADMGFSLKNEQNAVNKAMNYGKTGGRWGRYFKLRKLRKNKHIVKLEYELDNVAAIDALENSCREYENPAKDAAISKVEGGFTLTDAEDGKEVNKKEVKKKIEQKLNNQWNGKSFTIQTELVTEKPRIMKTQLAVIQDELGSYATECGNDGSGRVKNIQTGSGYVNGTVLLPGEEFSTNDAMKPYTKKRGYAKAGSYENGEVVETMGGGICQVSTTLYNAVLYAELEVTERMPHSMTVGYVDPSRDAAIADETKDFCFKNSTKYPIFIAANVTDGKLNFSIYGKDDRAKNRKVEYKSETLTTKDGGVKYVEDSKRSVGYMQTTSYGHTGKTAQLWKIVKVDGKQESKEVINKSSYAPSPVIISVGTKTSVGVSSGVEAAIGSQNESTIRNAVSSAGQ